MGNTVETGKNTVLITGATGFLGEYLVRRLTKEYRVLAMGRNREQGRKLEGLGAVFWQSFAWKMGLSVWYIYRLRASTR